MTIIDPILITVFTVVVIVVGLLIVLWYSERRDKVKYQENMVTGILKHWNGNIPVSPIAIADKLTIGDYPIAIKPTVDSKIFSKAYFRPETSTFVCEYKYNDTGFRQRFAQAHALGHVVLGHVTTESEAKQDTEFSKDTKDLDEVTANHFALQLLMPEEHMRNAARIYQGVDVLARVFDVSTACVVERLKQLDLLPHNA